MLAQWLSRLVNYFVRVAIAEDFLVPIIYTINESPHDAPLSFFSIVVVPFDNFSNNLSTAIPVLRVRFKIFGDSDGLADRDMGSACA